MGAQQQQVIRGTWFPDSSGQSCQHFQMSWPEFIESLRTINEADKEHAALIKLAAFGVKRTSKGSLRHNANVQTIYGLEGDYDAGNITPEEAIERLERHHLRAVVVTTHRHTPEKPRWRVYAPLGDAIQPNDRADYLSCLNGALGGILADESWRLSQCYYIGKPTSGEYQVLHTFDDPNEGYTLDELDPAERAELAIGPKNEIASTADDSAEPVTSFEAGEGLPDMVEDMLEHVGAVDYYDWITCGMALHYCDPIAGLDVWDRWSATAPNYCGREEIERRWATFGHNLGGRVNAGTLVNLARRSGYDGPAYSPAEVRKRIDRLGVDLSNFDIHSLPTVDTDVPMFASLGLLMSRPELLQPPAEIIPKLVWRGRTTAIIAPDKAGKSTLLGHAVAALTNGHHFLGLPVQQGTALVVAPDEAVGDTVRRLGELGAHPERTRLLTMHPERLIEYLRDEMQRETPSLLLVDSLAEWARLTEGRAPDDGDSAGWGAVVRPLVALSREFGCGIALLHHPRRSDGQYRGSGEIAAAMDALLEMRVPKAEENQPNRRDFSGRARWPIQEFSLEYTGSDYVMADGSLPLATRILIDLQVAGPSSRNAQSKRLSVRRETYLEAVNQMLEAGQLFEKNNLLHHPNYEND